ncbi:unnamed protein product [Lupinus luteus]|uniref:Uncharacterized protein n=1 Tax=Lupinus luteus TaxID=3873 RepID=A0AAV1VVB1_LUPLU
MSPKHKDDQSLPSDDCLHRATSLLMAQNPSQSDPWEFHGDTINFRSDKSFRKQEHSTKESNAHNFAEAPISAGPPSLNAWVLDKGSFSYKRNNGTNGHSEHKLEPIDEIPSSMEGDSINETEYSVSAYSDWSSTYAPHGHDPRFQPFSNGYPTHGKMSSSEWLRCQVHFHLLLVQVNKNQVTSTTFKEDLDKVSTRVPEAQEYNYFQ